MNFKHLDSLVDAAFVIDSEFKLHYGNWALAQICGVSARRLNRTARPLSDVIKIQDSLFESAQELSGIDEPSMQKEVEFSTEAGNKGWCQFTVQKVEECEGRQLWLVYLRDVSLEKSLHDKYREQLEAKEEVIDQLRKAQSELKQYSENLEEMVAVRTRELSEAMELQSATLDSLGQGFFIFNADGSCAPYYSKVCPQMFGVSPEGHSVVDVLKLQGETAATFRRWIQSTFSGALPFEDMLGLLPVEELQIGSTILDLSFYPMTDAQGVLKGIVTVATDVTAQRAAERELEREKKFAKMIHTVLKHQKQFISFTRDAMVMLDWLITEYVDAFAKNSEEFFRVLHTLKGGAATFGMDDLADRITTAEVHFHSIQASENSLERLQDHETMLKECVNQFRQTMNSIGSLLNLNLMATSRHVHIPVETLYQWYQRLETGEPLSELAGEMRNQYLFEEIRSLLEPLESEAQRLARLLGKELEPLQIGPAEFRLLPEPYEPLLATLVHFLRNALDHGIEEPGRRTEAGKPARGQITIHFEKVGQIGRNQLIITMQDDGAGIAVDILREKLRSHLDKNPDQLSDFEVLQTVFEDGVSTRSTANSVSGMGVGMSAIRGEARKLGGDAVIDSQPGLGTTLRINVPWIEAIPGQNVRNSVAKSA